MVDGKCLKIVGLRPSRQTLPASNLDYQPNRLLYRQKSASIHWRTPPFMFGRRQQPPRPPDREPLILLLLAVLIAGALTVSYGAIMAFVERLQSQ